MLAAAPSYHTHSAPRKRRHPRHACRRKYGLLGGSEADAARIDMVVDGVEDIKRK